MRRITSKSIRFYTQLAPLNHPKNQPELDEFSRQFSENKVELTTLQRYILGFGSSLAALRDPRRHDMIAALGETTGAGALRRQHDLLLASEEGRLILAEKPRINTKTIDLNQLRSLPENTFGFAYVKFLDDNEVTPDSREIVRYMEDTELAYMMTRYRESHDLVHTVLGMPTNMLGEVTVKWVEALNTGLPMCWGAAVFGSMRLRPKHRQLYKEFYLPWAIRVGKAAKPLLSVYWEKRWDQDISELREELNIETFKVAAKKV